MLLSLCNSCEQLLAALVCQSKQTCSWATLCITNNIMVFLVFLQEVIQQDQEAGFLKKPQPLQHSSSNDKTATRLRAQHPVSLQEITPTITSRALFHLMHPHSHKRQPILRLQQRRRQLQLQLLRQPQLPRQQLLLHFKISNKWVCLCAYSVYTVNFF